MDGQRGDWGWYMPVETLHPQYQEHSEKWTRARDCLAGEDTMKARGEAYIARLNSQSDEEFRRYVGRASFFNSVGRTKEGFSGLIFRRAPLTKVPESGGKLASVFQAFMADADLLGGSLDAMAKHLVGEVLTIGRAGTLVEWSDEEKRAFWVNYRAEDVLNWRMDRINGRYKLSLVVLRECVPPELDEDDPFDVEPVEQLRVLRLIHVGDAWTYTADIWRKIKEGEESAASWRSVELRIPVRNGKPLSEIPFVFYGPIDSRPEVQKSPLEDLIITNLDHYRLDADFKHGLHYTALPTAWVSGFDKDSSLQMGSSVAWVTETVGASAGFLEFKGEGLSTFERAQDRDERLMALLGSRLLEAQKRVGESAEAISLRQANESSVVANIAMSISISMTAALRWVYWWHSTEETVDQVPRTQVEFMLNTDFETAKMSAAELIAMVQAWQSGAISRDTFLDRAREGEIIAADRSNEEEKELIEAEVPPILKEVKVDDYKPSIS